MFLVNKNILLISPEPWDHIFVSKHHYAIHLARRDNKVFFLNPPSDHLSIKSTAYDSLYSVSYTGFVKGLRFLPQFLQRAIIKSKVRTLEKLCNTSFNVVWSFDNSVFFDFRAFESSTFCISHIVDLNQDFQTAVASSTADVCFGVINRIVQRHLAFNPRSYLVRHATPSFPGEISSMSLPGKNSLKALYSGNLYMPHINWPLLMEAFSEHSDVDFIFLGSNRRLIAEKYLKKLVDESNVFFCDAVPAEEVAHYLAAADILLLAYKPDYFNEYAYPHKMMEYLASGKPVVANYFQDLESESDLVYMATNDEHWLRQLDYVVKNLTDCSSPSKVAARSEFARRNTYSARVAEIENIIAESLRRRG